MIFRFRQFDITQQANAQKVGTDSVLLGAWTRSGFTTILDIGTGTGLLALMMRQKNLSARIVAIEPEKKSFEEAQLNFENARHFNAIESCCLALQDYQTDERFDLIISNPPYFDAGTQSSDAARNKARHTLSLSIPDLYAYSAKLLKPEGVLNLVFPAELEATHFGEAQRHGLFPQKILRTIRQDDTVKRIFVSYSYQANLLSEDRMIVKYKDNSYSKEYVEMTRDFYSHDLVGR